MYNLIMLLPVEFIPSYTGELARILLHTYNDRLVVKDLCSLGPLSLAFDNNSYLISLILL